MFEKKEKTKLKKWHLVAFGLIVIVFLGLKVYSWIVQPVKKIEIGGQVLSVMVADNPGERYKGLSGKKLTDKKQGMLFVFPNSDYYTFVMRGMDYSIDIIWINNGEIIDIAPNLRPEKGIIEADLTRYRPRLPANRVLEVEAGFAEKYGLKIGDRVEL